MDACGVCDGMNNTCGTTISLVVVVDPSAGGEYQWLDTESAVGRFISDRLNYPRILVRYQLETMDVTEMIPISDLYNGKFHPGADGFEDESKDFIFGRVRHTAVSDGAQSYPFC